MIQIFTMHPQIPKEGNGEGVTENSEVPQEPQIIRDMGGIDRYRVL